jgi:alpha-tubulin suppressor-like RCC1 family protein
VSAGGTGVLALDQAFNEYDGDTCGIRSGGALFCWGYNVFGQVGDGTTTDRNLPTREATSAAWNEVSVGRVHSCAIASGGALYCWGNNGGRFGNGSTANSSTPTPTELGSWVIVSAGAQHTVALRSGDDTF